jgi:hypothetical protein
MTKRIIVYGPSKIGISSFLAKNEQALFIDTFDSLGRFSNKIRIVDTKTPRYKKVKISDTEIKQIQLTPLESLYQIIRRLNNYNNEPIEKNQYYEYNTLIIDSLFGLEQIIHNHICAANKIDDIEYLKYGKGHHLAYLELKRFLEKLDELARNPIKPMNVIIAAHSTIETYTTLYQENTSRSVLSTSIKPPKENVAEFLKVWSDGLLYVDDFNTVTGGYFRQNLEEITGCSVKIFTKARPNFDAGCNFIESATINLTWQELQNFLGNEIKKEEEEVK